LALNFFTQRDIDSMDAHDIPEEFVNYFDGLSDERKAEIVDSRPDLATGLGYVAQKSLNIEEVKEETNSDEEEIDANVESEDIKQESEEVTSKEDETSDIYEDVFAEINNNIYEGMDLIELAKTEVDPLVALSFRDEEEKCRIHRTKYTIVQLNYRRGRGTYGVQPRYCKECVRYYIKESQVEYVTDALTERGVKVKIYPIDVSEAFIRHNMPEVELGEDEKIYIPDVWVEENPTCPIHGDRFEEYPYVLKYKDREIKFNGCFCAKCNKTALRKTKALDLEDECAAKGIPMPETEVLTARVPKKILPKKEVKPEYFISDGKKLKYEYDKTGDCFELTEEDTVVVSDSIYCNLMDHDTEEVTTLFWVNMRREGRKAFLSLMGYCSQCQKYYMAEEDYKAIYSLGRPEFAVISEIEDSEYQITSGEVFELEKDHLGELERDLNAEVDDIRRQPDYVSQFEKGIDYDDIAALQWKKKVSADRYEPLIEKWTGYMPKPYTYRVDISFNGKSETYYIGADDIELGSGHRVISFNSDFGKKLVNYRTLNIIKNGKQYDIKLSRQFDIDRAQLFGYVNLRTDEDIIFRTGITDPFLIKVLNLRKKQHNLVDIIATIQENQNNIVDVPMDHNMVIQGCAGSGKTMVLLHRLSSLKYNHPEFDFGQALILTPNDQFSLHIKGLAEGLQIGSVDRVSVEQYYLNTLRQYSAEFVPANKLASEVFVNQKYVDYIYSDEFFEQFKIAYAEVIAERNKLVTILQGATEAVGEVYSEIDLQTDSEVVPAVKRKVDHIDSQISANKKAISDAEQGLWFIEHRKEDLGQRIPKAEEFMNGIMTEILPRVYNKIGAYMSSIQHNIDEQQEIIDGINAEAMKVENQLLPFGKRSKLDELKKNLDKATRKKNSEQAKLDDARAVFDFPTEGKTDDEIIAWLRQVSLYEQTVREEIRLYERTQSDLKELLEEQAGIEEKIIDAAEKLKIAQIAKFAPEVEQSILYLKSRCEEYGALSTYKLIFAKAIAPFVEENKIKNVTGTHRYDLYMQLWFCMKYYRRRLGTYSFICVDEGQDMSFNEYRMVYELNHKKVIFNIYGDTNQLLKPGRGIDDWTRLKEEYQMEEYTLNENYRNTNQITRFCNASFGMDVMQTGVDGAKVREIPRRDLEKELAALHVNSERIAILVPRRVRKQNYLNKSILPSNISSLIGSDIDNGKISFMYVDEVKGIEFDKVFVISNKMTKNEKYIAYTRALAELVIVVDDNITDESAPAEET